MDGCVTLISLLGLVCNKSSSFTYWQSVLLNLFQEPPFLDYSGDSNAEGNDRYVGYIPDMMKKIQEATGIQYEFYIVNDGR